ncbi:hypothetical protein ACF0H5_009492 [Mactra antiquata]
MNSAHSRAERPTSVSDCTVTTVTNTIVRSSSQIHTSEILSRGNIYRTVARPAFTNSFTLVNPNIYNQAYSPPNVNPFSQTTSGRSSSSDTKVTQASAAQYRSQFTPSVNSDTIKQLLLSNQRKTTVQPVPSNQNTVEIVKLLQSKSLHVAKQQSSDRQEVKETASQALTQQALPFLKTQDNQNIRRQLLLLQHKLKIQQDLKQEVSQFTGQIINTGPLPTGQFIKSASPQFTESVIIDDKKDIFPPHMTASKTLATQRPKEPSKNMDGQFCHSSELSPFINTCGELPLSTDFIDASIYASSPNSLHLYDQEKIDMQCSMGSTTVCSTFDPISSPDDFELKAQYENTQDISSLPLMETLPTVGKCDLNPRITNTHEPMIDWESCVKRPQDVYIKMESPDTSAPTLAELNSPTYDLSQELDDIDSYIHLELAGSSGEFSHSLDTALKGNQTSTGDIKEKTVINVNDKVQTKSACDTHVKEQSLEVPVIKTEPMDVYSLSPGSNVHGTSVKLETTTVKRPSERNSPLKTIREIDISDATTLQRLLSSKIPIGAREPRKRTISEPQTSTRSVSLRKRSFDSTGLDMDKKWEEIKQFLHTEIQNSGETTIPSPPIKRERTRYDSTSSIMTLTSTEDDDSDSDKDFDDESDSDMEGGNDLSTLSASNSLIGAKEKQYFWQYNVQSKGPKGTRAKFDLEEDPHVLNDFEDPVFGSNSSGTLNSIGITVKHGGKARKGDGNDIVPSPKKLCQIGLQLRKINKQINEFVPVSELPSQARGKTRKEKNKLASRACRLKKKAQHEANKVKLHGLEMEHRNLLTVIHLIRHKLYEHIKQSSSEGKECMTDVLQSLVEQYLSEMVGGNTTDYVNSVILKVEGGNYTGGLNIQATRSYPKELHN